MSNCEKLKEELPSTEKFYSFLNNRKVSDKQYEYILKDKKKAYFS